MRRRSRFNSALAPCAGSALAALLLSGCDDSRQNLLHPASKAARSISHLWWWMMAAAWVGFGAIAFLILLGWARRNRPNLPLGGGDRAATVLVVVLGIALPMAALTALFVVADIFVIRTTDAPGAGAPLTIDVVGHQWFWAVRYPGTRAVTANELHIPVATPVAIVGTTRDVIHSFWVPQLNRKIDLIPGRENRVVLEADRPGVFRGQCAEFCGLQHAHMAVRVVAEPPARFRAWLAGQAAPAREPVTAEERRGERVFMSSACSGCHAIRGTPASGTLGPDLTHVAARSTLAAVTIPNSPADLAEWIRDPQHVKPGNRMPALTLPGQDVTELVAYLDSLH